MNMYVTHFNEWSESSKPYSSCLKYRRKYIYSYIITKKSANNSRRTHLESAHVLDASCRLVISSSSTNAFPAFGCPSPGPSAAMRCISATIHSRCSIEPSSAAMNNGHTNPIGTDPDPEVLLAVAMAVEQRCGRLLSSFARWIIWSTAR